MTIAQAFLAEFKVESEKTRKFLERVPEKDFEFRPHPKSMSMGQLAAHLAEIPGWGNTVFDVTEFNFDPATYQPWTPASTSELLKKFDDGVANMSKSLAKQSDADLAVVWSMKMNGEPRFSMPRTVVFRNFILNHIIHHRAQLGVYLRLKEVPVPMTYGPSADEQ